MRTSRHKQVLLFAIFVCLLTNGYPQTHIASIIGKRGQVHIKKKSDKEWKPAEVATRLSEGDSVKTRESSKVVILYFKGNKIRLGANKSHLVQKKPKENFSFAGILKWFFGENEIPQPGSSRGLGDRPLIHYPRYGKVLSSEPGFAWFPAKPGTVYKVKLVKGTGTYCQQSGIDLWEVSTQDTSLDFPDNQENLVENQQYWLELRYQLSEGKDYGCFTVTSEEERLRIQNKLEDIHENHLSDDLEDVSEIIDSVSFLMEEEYFTEALKMLLKAYEHDPRNESVRAMLAFLYEEVGPRPLIGQLLDRNQ